MKIVHVITRLIVGGAQENTILSCRGLIECGHEVVLLTGPETGPEGGLFELARAYGVRVEVIRNLRRNVHPLRDVAALGELVGMISKLGPDVVHTHSSKAGILGRLAARLAGVKAVVHTVHGLPFFPYQSKWANWAYIQAERLAARWTDKIVAVAEDMVKQACAAGVGPREKFVTIYSGLDGESFFVGEDVGKRVREELGIPQDAFVVGKVARLAPGKGHEYLLDALEGLMRRYDKLWCVLVGDGVLGEQIEARVAKAGMPERVRMVGLVDPGRIPGLLAGMDMLVHTSLHEGLPRAVVQGLLAGLVVGAFDLDGAKEVIEAGKGGYLIEAESVSELVEAIEQTIQGAAEVRALDWEQRRALAARFSWRKMVEELDGLYRGLVGEGQGQTRA